MIWESIKTRQLDLGSHSPEAFACNHLLGHFFPPPRPGPKERGVDSVTHFYGNCLEGKGNISDVRNTVLTHLIKRLRSCFRDANQDVVKATTIGSFKLWPAKINQGNPWALALILLFFKSVHVSVRYVTFSLAYRLQNLEKKRWPSWLHIMNQY